MNITNSKIKHSRIFTIIKTANEYLFFIILNLKNRCSGHKMATTQLHLYNKKDNIGNSLGREGCRAGHVTV